MVDLESGNTLKTFPSQHAAARWLVENGKAKNTNCVTSISSVCRKSPCTTGYGYRKKAYGYGWSFAVGRALPFLSQEVRPNPLYPSLNSH